MTEMIKAEHNKGPEPSSNDAAFSSTKKLILLKKRANVGVLEVAALQCRLLCRH
jgi:hypothetical protein